MKIILLPGLDGTGALFDALVNNLREGVDTEVLTYEKIDSLTYTDQAEEIGHRIKDTDVVLVGESYSGRVVYELNQILGERVKAVVFIASFISCPSKVAKLAGYIPIGLLKPNFINKSLLNIFGFNRQATPTLIDSVFSSISSANKQKLKARLKNISGLTKSQVKIYSPVTYIRPNRDLLVGRGSVEHIKSLCVNFKEVTVSGGHFIAQSEPEECAKVILNAASM